MSIAEEVIDVFLYYWKPKEYEGDTEKVRGKIKDIKFSTDPLKYVYNLGGELLGVRGYAANFNERRKSVAVLKFIDDSIIFVDKDRQFVMNGGYDG